MERSTLERKDRAELAAVAGALGLKVPSRAKKADIITLILEAVGQDKAGETAQPSLLDEAAQQPAKPAEEATTKATHAEGSGSGPEADRTAGDEASDSDDDSDGEAGDDAAAEESGEDAAADGGSSRRRRRRRGRDRGDANEAQATNGQGGDAEPEPIEVQGLLDLREDGYGFLRVSGFVAGREDVYVSVKQCRQLGLRKGDYVSGVARPATHKEKNPALVRVETVNGLDPEQARDRVRFEDLVATDPGEQIVLGGRNGDDLTGDLIDALAPVRQGQRHLIVTPIEVDPRPVLEAIVRGVEQGMGDSHLIVLLVDESPETVASFRKSLDGGELVSAAYDRPPEQQAAIAELALEHAKRLVEYGNDVVVLINSLTGLTRAYNLAANPGGRMIAGELDASALAAAKRVFGAGRNVEDGGSLTVIATALSETRSQVDEAILTELRRAANATLVLEAATPPVAPRPLVVGAPLAEQKSLLGELTK